MNKHEKLVYTGVFYLVLASLLAIVFFGFYNKTKAAFDPVTFTAPTVPIVTLTQSPDGCPDPYDAGGSAAGRNFIYDSSGVLIFASCTNNDTFNLPEVDGVYHGLFLDSDASQFISNCVNDVYSSCIVSNALISDTEITLSGYDIDPNLFSSDGNIFFALSVIISLLSFMSSAVVFNTFTKVKS